MQSHVRAEDASNGGKRTEVGGHARRPPAIWDLPFRVPYFAPCNGGSPVQRPRSPPAWLAFAEPSSACKCGAALAAAAQERQGARIWIRICGQSWRAPSSGIGSPSTAAIGPRFVVREDTPKANDRQKNLYFPARFGLHGRPMACGSLVVTGLATKSPTEYQGFADEQRRLS